MMSVSMDTIIKKLLSPSAALMNRLGLRTKLLAMFVTLMLPTLLLVLYMVSRMQADVTMADHELRGIQINRQVMDVLLQTQKHRGQVNLKLSGENNDSALEQTRKALAGHLSQLNQNIRTNSKFGLEQDWKTLEADLQQLTAGQIAATAAANMQQHNALIARLLRFSQYASEKTGLLLDPEASTYFLMDASISRIPHWTEQIAQLRGAGAGLIRSGTISPEDKAAILARIEILQASVGAFVQTADALQRAGEQLQGQETEALQATQRFVALARQNLLGDAISGNAGGYFAEGTQAIEKTVALQKRLHQRLTDILEQRLSNQSWQRNLIVAVMSLLFIVSAYLLLGFYRGFMQSLMSVRESAVAVAAGDLTRQIHLNGSDELAETGNTLEQMNLNLSKLVANVRTNASMVSQLGESLASGISDLSERTEQQASSLEQTSASVEDLADTVRKNADSARSVSTLAGSLSQIAESGGVTMHAAVDSMQGIQQGALKVQEIIGIIDGIAFQTNILALNAAVEAARAGEQGRGFAVVATEVRNLAQRSAESARQIRTLIDNSVTQVRHGVGQINDVNQTLDQIVSGIRELATSIHAISTASDEQSNGLAQISEAIHHLDQITQSNGQMADQARITSVNLEERASHLTRAVSSFNLRQGTADEAHAMVKQAVALFRASGRSALSAITADREHRFSKKDMYVFAFNRQGQYLAFGGNADKLKVNLLQVSGLNGRQLISDAFALPASGGWVNYSIVNPVSHKVENKTSYIEAVTEDIVLGCGVYRLEGA